MPMEYILFLMSILLSSLCTLNSAQNALGNIIGIGAETAADILQQTYGYFQQERCPFRENVHLYASGYFQNYIAGQDEAVASILKAIASWQLSRQAGCEEGQCHSSPKVLAFTGPTGVGKTETASKLVESFLARRSKVGNGYAQRPQGFLSLRGEEYSNSTQLFQSGIGAVRKTIQSQIINHIANCQGNAVIVFDEIQKVAPGALDALVPLMDSNGFFSYPVRGPSSDSNKDRSYVEYFGSFVIPSSAASPSSSAVASTEEEYHTETISTSNVVFILISDIGKDLFWKLVLKYRDRSRIPPEELREEVRKLMEKQWRKLQFQRNIQEVIPFMPLERSHIRRIMAMKFQQYSRYGLFVKWMGVSIDSNVLDYFSASDKFIAYDPFEMTVVGKKDPAVAGNNGHAQNTEKVSCTDKANVCAMLADRPTVEKMEFAKYGARDIERVLGSSFKALLFQYMQPWRPYEIVHVGLISAMDESFYNEMRLLHRSQATDTIFLQWCRPVASMLEAVNQSIYHDLLDSSGTIKMGRLHYHLLSSSGIAGAGGGSGSAVRVMVRSEHVSSDTCQFIAFATI